MREELGLYAVLEAEGLNVGCFINSLKRAGVSVYRARKLSERTVIFTVPRRRLEKVFAIGEELCYNITIKRHTGVFYPVYALLKNVGILVGALIFAAAVFAASFAVGGIEVTGSAALYRTDIIERLESYGVKKNSFVSGEDLKNASKKLVGDCGYLGFVTIKKTGFTLRVSAELNKISGAHDFTKTSLIAPVNGTIRKLTVFRGLAKKSVGESVFQGEEIVTGAYTVGEKEYSTYILYECELETDFIYEYKTDNGCAEKIAETLALDVLSGGEIVGVGTVKKEIDKVYVYTVTVRYIVKL